MSTATSFHPFDPISPGEIELAVKILHSAFPGVPLRFKRIDIQEPIKKDVVPYIEAERLGKPLPPKPARLLLALVHRLDTGLFFKAVLNAGTKSVLYAKELPKDTQVSEIAPGMKINGKGNDLLLTGCTSSLLLMSTS